MTCGRDRACEKYRAERARSRADRKRPRLAILTTDGGRRAASRSVHGGPFSRMLQSYPGIRVAMTMASSARTPWAAGDRLPGGLLAARPCAP